MTREDRYREAARRMLAVTAPVVSIEPHGSVSILAPTSRESLGNGAFVEASVWVPREAAEAVEETE